MIIIMYFIAQYQFDKVVTILLGCSEGRQSPKKSDQKIKCTSSLALLWGEAQLFLPKFS